MRTLLTPLFDFARALDRHNVFTHGAATAFFLFLSLPPALLALVALVGMVPIEEWTEGSTAAFLDAARDVFSYFAPKESADAMLRAFEWRTAPLFAGLQDLTTVGLVQRVQELLDQALPADVARAVGTITANILGNPRPGLLTASFAVILWSASGATRAATRALGAIYEVQRRSWFARNALALGLTLGFLLTWTLSIAILPVSNALAVGVVSYLGLDAGVLVLWSSLNWVLGGALLWVTVLTLNRLGPGVSLRWRALVPGSLLTVALWIALSYGLGLWIQQSWNKYNTTYGTLAGVIVILLWSYLLALGLLLGAELNTAVLRWRRSRRGSGAGVDVAAQTREAVEGEVVLDPLERAVAAVEEGVFARGEARNEPEA